MDWYPKWIVFLGNGKIIEEKEINKQLPDIMIHGIQRDCQGKLSASLSLIANRTCSGQIISNVPSFGCRVSDNGDV